MSRAVACLLSLHIDARRTAALGDGGGVEKKNKKAKSLAAVALDLQMRGGKKEKGKTQACVCKRAQTQVSSQTLSFSPMGLICHRIDVFVHRLTSKLSCLFSLSLSL